MKSFLVAANVFAFGLVVATCGPIVMHGTQRTACSAIHMGCRTERVSIHFQKIALRTSK